MIYTDFPDIYELKAYANAMNTRAKQAQVKGRITAILLRSIILESAGKCGWCGQNLLKKTFEIDHIHPLIRGGTNTVDNLVMACVSCNRRKSDKPALRFALEMSASVDEKTPLVRQLIDDNNIDALHQPTLL